MKTFKIKHVGLDTERLDYTYTSEVDFDWVHTSISANNDFNLTEIINESTGLVTSIDFLDNCLSVIMKHLMNLNRKHVEILLVDSKCDFEKYKAELKSAVDNERVLGIGIKNPDSVDRIKEIKGSLESEGLTLGYVALDICPMNFDASVVKYCGDEGIKLIGFNPFGGYLGAPEIITSFGVTYLLEFISYYCDYVFVSGNYDYSGTLTNIGYAKSLIGKEASSIYELKKSIKKLQKPLKKAIYTSVKFGENIVLPVNNPEYVYDYEELVHSLGKEVKEVKDLETKSVDLAKDDTVDIITSDVLSIISNLHKPEDGSDLDFLYIIRNNIRTYLETEFPIERGWFMTEVRMGEKIFTYGLTKETVEKKFFSKDIVHRHTAYFVLYYSDGEVVFKIIPFASENPSKPK